MAVERTITRENFKLLLNWLDANEAIAAEKYERIRQRLIRVFVGRGCYEAEILADQTIDRVTLKAPELADRYDGDPALYFYGVANKCHLEWLRSQKRVGQDGLPDVAVYQEEENDSEFECLETCLNDLPVSSRDLIIEYYQEEKQAKIDRRKQLAKKLGITIGALQIKASRIRSRLLRCVEDCTAGT